MRERTLLSFLLPYAAAAIAVVSLVIGALAITGHGNAASATSPSGPAKIQVTLSEFAIAPNHLMASPGDIEITVSNAGKMDHNFDIAGLKGLSALRPGETRTLRLNAVKDGTYDVTCTIPGHAASGMKATLMVAAGAVMDGSASAAPTGAEPVMDPTQMDKLMEEVAKKYPQKTNGHGGDPLEPKVQADGTKEFDLTAEIVDWEVSAGNIVKAWTYNGVVPAPEIHVQVGDKVRVVLTNKLPESTSLHFHGIRVPNAMDGVDPYTQPPIKPGETFTYEFTAQDPAVGIYHSHHDAQIQVPNGMFGAFLIGDMPVPASLGKVNVVKRYNMVLNDAGTIGLSLNGKSFPATEPVTLQVGESMIVNYLNEGLMAHPMHLHQPVGYVIAKDGVPLDRPMPGDTINVAPGERYTVLYTAVEKGVWAWHCHILNHAETPQGMTGMVTALIVS